MTLETRPILLRIPKRFRAVCAAWALSAYVLPLALGLLAQLGHGVEHALALLDDLERRAAAMGVAHLHDVMDHRDHAAYVHAHGGAEHAHDAGIGALLVASDEADERAAETGVVAPIELSSHLPSDAALSVLSMTHQRKSRVEPDAAVPRTFLPPPLPPPRA